MRCKDCVYCQDIEGPLDLPATVYIVTCTNHAAQLFFDVPDGTQIPFDKNGERYTPYLALNAEGCPFYISESSYPAQQPIVTVSKERVDLSRYAQVVAEPKGFGG